MAALLAVLVARDWPWSMLCDRAILRILGFFAFQGLVAGSVAYRLKPRERRRGRDFLGSFVAGFVLMSLALVFVRP